LNKKATTTSKRKFNFKKPKTITKIIKNKHEKPTKHKKKKLNSEQKKTYLNNKKNHANKASQLEIISMATK
jgi:hypothetical protein